MLRIPDSEALLPGWIKEIAEECMRGSSERGAYYRMMQNYYETGTTDRTATNYNAIKPLVERTAGYLYASHDVRFRATFPSVVNTAMLEYGNALADHLTGEYRRADMDLTFGDAVRLSLLKGAAFLKHRPDGFGVSADIVDPLCLGVMRQNSNELEQQEAVCQISFPTLSELWSMAGGGGSEEDNRIADALIDRVKRATETPDEERGGLSVLVGQLDPLGEPNEPVAGQGSVDLYGGPRALGPSPARNTVRLVELWVQDPDRGGDYTTLQMVYPDVVVLGIIKKRNIFGIKGRHPYTMVQPRRRQGFLYGQSMIGDLIELQEMLTEKLGGIRRMWRRNVRPPIIFSGAEGNIPESWDAMENDLGGYMVDAGVNAKAQPVTTPVGPQEIEEVQWILSAMDSQTGFAPVLQGRGESGVRAQGHAETLVRTASPPLLRMAARTERQLADSGYLAARLLQQNDPTEYRTEDGLPYRLKMVSDDFGIEVDSHSASPAFADVARQDAVLLMQAHAIGPEDFIELIHPPHTELILKRLKAREAQAAAMQQQQAAQGAHPPHKETRK